MSKEDMERYYAAAHAMQTAVALTMERDGAETSPKHLRVGVNVALRDLGSLVALLVEKGVITPDEYQKAIADGMEEEVETYRKGLDLPDNVTLG